MELTVDFLKEKKIVTLSDSSTVETLISHLGLLPDNVLIISEENVLPLSASLCDGQKIKIVQVASGG